MTNSLFLTSAAHGYALRRLTAWRRVEDTHYPFTRRKALSLTINNDEICLLVAEPARLDWRDHDRRETRTPGG